MRPIFIMTALIMTSGCMQDTDDAPDGGMPDGGMQDGGMQDRGMPDGDGDALVSLDGGGCIVDAYLGDPCTEGRTCARGPVCWGGRERLCPPGFSRISAEECVDNVYTGDLKRTPDPRCPANPTGACPGLHGLVCVVEDCPTRYIAMRCEDDTWQQAWESVGCRE